MRLKNHREDVKYLKRLAENRLSLAPIATRYLNLIRMAEETFDYRLSPYSKSEERVLKDAEK